MIKFLKLLVFFLSFVVLLYFGYESKLIGDHKLCEGMELNEIQNQNFTLQYNENLNLLKLQGPFEIGVLSAVKKLLLQHPESSGIILDSEGGNVYQARGIAKVILAHSLNTYTFNICYSACTIAFVAGTKRYLGKDGKLGFHQYNINLEFMNPVIDIESEQNKDLDYYESRIPDLGFIGKIFDSGCDGIWIPTRKDLLLAGAVHEVVSEIE